MPSPKKWLLAADGPAASLPGGETAIFPLWDGWPDGPHEDVLPAGGRVQRAMARIRGELAGLCAAVGQDVLARGSGFNGWWLSLLAERNPGKTDAFAKIAQVAAVEGLLAETGAEGLAIQVGDKMLSSALSALAARKGLEWRLLGSGRPLARFARRCANKLRLLKGIARIALRASLARLVLCGVPRGAGDDTVVTYFPHVDAGEAAQGRFRNTFAPELQDLLRDAGRRVFWLLVYVPNDGRSFLQSLRLARRLRAAGEPMAFWEEFLTAGAFFRALWDWARGGRGAPAAGKLAARLAQDSPFPEAGDFLRGLAVDSLGGLDALAGWMYHHAFRRAFEGRGGRVFYFAEMHGWERALAAALGAPGAGRLFAYQHAAVGPNELNYHTLEAEWSSAPGPDFLVANGAIPEKMLRAGGHPAVVRAEALRHLALGRAMKLPLAPRDLPVLALGGIDWRESLVLLRWLGLAFAQEPSIPLSLRLHPSCDRRRVLRDAPPGSLPSLRPAPAGAVHGVLARTRVVIAGSTSLALDALALGCRVVLPLFAERLSFNPLLEAEPWRDAVDSPAALHAAVARRLEEPFDPAYAERARAYVREYWDMDESLPRWKEIVRKGISHA